MTLYPIWLPGLAFVDRLLRFGVATLFALDVIFDAHTKITRWGGYAPYGFYRWLDYGLNMQLAELVGWTRSGFGLIGAFALLTLFTAPLGALLVSGAVAIDLYLSWKLWWIPSYRMQFVVGCVLVLISQTILRTHIRKAQNTWRRFQYS